MTQKIPYPVKVKLMQHFNKKLDSVELDLKDKLLLHPELDVLDGKALALTGAGKVASAVNTVAEFFGFGQVVPVTIAEVVAAKVGVTVAAVTTAMTAGGAIIAAAGATYLMNEFSKPEKRQEIKRALVKSYNDKIRPQLENWAKEQIDLCNE
ncbi:hypothetical protein J6253_01855 [bacterium]|nr:hypothetical protein [bacterium]